MIEVLRNIFIAVLYLFGIGLIGFFAIALWAAIVRFIWGHRHD